MESIILCTNFTFVVWLISCKILPTLTTRESLQSNNRPFSYYEKESQAKDTSLHFVEFSNVHNSDRSSNATRSNLVYKDVLKITLDPGSFAE